MVSLRDRAKQNHYIAEDRGLADRNENLAVGTFGVHFRDDEWIHLVKIVQKNGAKFRVSSSFLGCC